ncbi:MAG: hypothetical protein EOM16_02130 [Bacteroidia bacterium]|nr:hypothetical protein [Bacteroidia bacterium]
MTEARHKRIWILFFKLYATFHLKRKFFDVRYHIEGNTLPKTSHGRPVLIVSNHFSFWDGFIHMLFVHKLFKKRIFIMMLQEQLQRHPFLRYGGCFSVNRGRRDVVESLRYGYKVLEDKANALLIFPQGEVSSLYTANFRFMKGAAYLANNSPGSHVWMNVNLVNYFSQKKPLLNIYLKRFHGELSMLESEFNSFAQECREKESPEVNGDKLI